MTIGERIKKLRTELGITQRQLAKICGWSSARINSREKSYDPGQIRISCYERNIYEPSIEQLLVLSKALRVSIGAITKNLNKDTN